VQECANSTVCPSSLSASAAASTVAATSPSIGPQPGSTSQPASPHEADACWNSQFRYRTRWRCWSSRPVRPVQLVGKKPAIDRGYCAPLGLHARNERGSRGQIPVMGDASIGGLQRDNAGVRCRPRTEIARSVLRPSGDMPAAIAADSPPEATRRRAKFQGMNRDDLKPRGESTLTRLPLRYQS
jgi:hypothetical protein